MICPTFATWRVIAVIVLVAITAWTLGARNATPHGADRVRQEQSFPTSTTFSVSVTNGRP